MISQFTGVPVAQTLSLLTLGSLTLSAACCAATAWLYWAPAALGVAGLLAADGVALAVALRCGRRHARGGATGARPAGEEGQELL